MSCNSALEPLMRSPLRISWGASTQVRHLRLTVTPRSCPAAHTVRCCHRYYSRMHLCPTTVRFRSAGFADFGEDVPQRTGWEAVPQREADLVPLRFAVQHARTPAEASTAQAALDTELSRRRRIDASVRLAVSYLLRNEAAENLLQVCSAQFCWHLHAGPTCVCFVRSGSHSMLM